MFLTRAVRWRLGFSLTISAKPIEHDGRSETEAGSMALPHFLRSLTAAPRRYKIHTADWFRCSMTVLTLCTGSKEITNPLVGAAYCNSRLTTANLQDAGANVY